MLRVGLTGGMGAGKSTAAAVLRDSGATVIDADAIAREVVEPGTDGLRALVEEFGGAILSDGALDRAALAEVAFADDRARLRLNSILHPRIGARTQELVEAAGDTIVVQDIPLLVEGGMAPMFHIVLVVDADVRTRVARLVSGRGLGEQDARSRIAAQASTAQRRAAADVWLDNSGAPGALDPVLGRLWRHRLVPFCRNLSDSAPAVAAHEALTASNPDGPGPAAQRMLGRIRTALGECAESVDIESADARVQGGRGPSVVVRPTASGSAPDPAERLRVAGFVPAGTDEYLSADPGAPARLTVRG